MYIAKAHVAIYIHGFTSGCIRYINNTSTVHGYQRARNTGGNYISLKVYYKLYYQI